MSVKIFEASVALVVYKNKVLLMLRDNIPNIYYPNTWGLIGGILDPGETPDQAMIREAKEEANITVQELTHIQSAPHVLDKTKLNHLYLIRLSDDDFKELKLGQEGQKLDFFTLDEIKKLDITPGVQNLLDNHFQMLEKFVNSI